MRTALFGRVLVVALLSGAVGLSPSRAQDSPLVGRVATQYAGLGDNALFMPTGVAVGPRGAVYVADGVHDRIAVFRPDGHWREDLRVIGGEQLRGPLDVHVSDEGEVWIADTGNSRIVVAGPDGRLRRVLVPPAGLITPKSELACVALDEEAGVLWVADNDRHQVLRCVLDAEQWRSIGRLGQSLGEFHYPFMLDVTPVGELLVTDVINGRVQRLSREGVPTGAVGDYGVHLGQFYRPKAGVADASGNVWVSDGTLGVVQAFTPDGRLIDVLRNERGEPMKFDLPMGLAFDAAEALYVVELRANRVVKLELTRNRQAVSPAGLTRRDIETQQPQSRACTACHFEWMQPLASGRGTVLVDVPPNPPSHPWVSREVMCLGCHDGSVGDARQRVWVAHGHRVGIVPPPSVTIPVELPLADGEIACRTCHSAHTLPEERTTIETIVFLREAESPAQLCMRCHVGFQGGVERGMHPLSEMPVDWPEELRRVRRHTSDEAVTCLACHRGHGVEFDPLLVLDPDKNELCLACHGPLEPDLFGAESRSAHGRLPRVTDEQQAVIPELASRLNAADELTCRTCHVSHNAPTDQYLLTFQRSRDTCAACHAAQREVVDSPHDLRTNYPEATNVLGQTPAEAGACSSCHTAHRDGRPPEPTPLNPNGRCMNCHGIEGLAQDARLGPVNHPQEECAACHNPHDTTFEPFLIGRAADLCRDCHEPQAGVAGGPHDLVRSPGDWPAVSAETGDRCLACHRPHGNERTGLFRAAPVADAMPLDAPCLACHTDTGPHAGGDNTLLHPQAVAAMPDGEALPVASLEGDEKWIACDTCHDPHRGAGVPHLFRIGADEIGEDLCIDCHIPRANIHMIGHAEGPMESAGFEVGSCKPCHMTHGDPQAVEPYFMWPKWLSDYEGREDVSEANHYCIACHREDGPVAPPEVASHPDVEMYNPVPTGSAAYLPLFDDKGTEAADGDIACRTCHLTHGRSTPAPIPRRMATVGTRELRARQWHVRTFVGSNVCTTCHGTDALRRFMYFHDPARRGGPIEGGFPGQ